MKKNGFPYQALLDVYHGREESLMAEIGSLEETRAGLEQSVNNLSAEGRRAQKSLGDPGGRPDRTDVLRHLNGILFRIRESRSREAEIHGRIAARKQDLRAIRMERMRYGKLKERYDREAAYLNKREEQRVSDEFSQRKNVR